jgi:hypothetical protein
VNQHLSLLSHIVEVVGQILDCPVRQLWHEGDFPGFLNLNNLITL